jgi:tRNA (uracil-5-)-methyltransferase
LGCVHFGSCGSCSLYALSYEEQLKKKITSTKNAFAPFYKGEIETFSSPSLAYRARAEFRIWHEGDQCFYAMGNREKNGVITLQECPKVLPPIENRMWRLLEVIHTSPLLSHKLFAIEFLSTTTDEVLVTLLYHKQLDEAWKEEAKRLEAQFSCFVMGRARKQKIVLSQEYVTEQLCVDGRVVSYREYESGFTQPNPYVNVHMIEWAIAQVEKGVKDDFLELYCGLGNFTLPLSLYFDKVLATEISKRSIEAAKENCKLNSVENIAFVRLSSEEMVEALQGVRTFRRLERVEIKGYHFSTVLVDPPRAGLDKATIRLIQEIQQILYISCNPNTLMRDLEVLTQTHNVVNVALFDQFPHTEHIESGVYLVKKQR